ncbi:unnamed protein product, partial [Staurois parvus]
MNEQERGQTSRVGSRGSSAVQSSGQRMVGSHARSATEEQIHKGASRREVRRARGQSRREQPGQQQIRVSRNHRTRSGTQGDQTAPPVSAGRF